MSRGELHDQETALALAMRQAQQGDAMAYRTLLESVRALMIAYANRHLRRIGVDDESSQDDLVQEILLAVHAKRHTWDPGQLFTPWLFAIARYKLIDFGRRKRSRGEVELEDVFEAPVFAEPETVSDLEKLLSQLPEKSRMLLEKVKLEGLSVAEAAAASGMSEPAVKVAVHRALKKLRALLGTEEAR